jgi:glyoxylase-like metal-dependent hydrolase (beta-lactamase superfamily II)
MASFEIVLKGEIIRKNDLILYASSTVCFIDDGIYLIVDTGNRDKKVEILERMNEIGISPKEIDVIFNTHAHRDHIGNNELFVNAKIFAPEVECLEIPKAEVSLDFLSDNVRVLKTPGHTWNHSSVLIDEKICVAGDAIPTLENLKNWSPPRIHVSKELAMESMRRIIESSELIIPGHDDVCFREDVNNWLKSK